MENFGIFCLFAILIAVLVGAYHIFINTVENDHEGVASAFLLLVMAADLLFMYHVFHHGLWMILRDR